jgi:hypothetical protein
MQQAHSKSLTENPHAQPPGYLLDEDFEEIEAYVRDLKTTIEELRDSSCTAWSGVGLRVAKHLTYPARQVLWEDIQTSIANLEERAESVLNDKTLRARGGRKPDRNRRGAA